MRRRRLNAVTLRVTLAVEDLLHAGLVTVAWAFGRREIRVLPFIGYGTPSRLLVRGRVVLGRPAVRPVTADLPSPDGVPTGGRGRRVRRLLVRGPLLRDPSVGRSPVGGRYATARARWASVRDGWSTFREALGPFLTVEVPGSPVSVHPPGASIAPVGGTGGPEGGRGGAGLR